MQPVSPYFSSYVVKPAAWGALFGVAVCIKEKPFSYNADQNRKLILINVICSIALNILDQSLRTTGTQCPYGLVIALGLGCTEFLTFLFKKPDQFSISNLKRFTQIRQVYARILSKCLMFSVIGYTAEKTFTLFRS